METVIKMGKNKDAAIGFGVIAVIIAIIVGGVIAILPEESETTQNEVEKNEPVSLQEKPIQSEIEPSKETKLDTEEKVLEFIKNYKGKDYSWLTLDETL